MPAALTDWSNKRDRGFLWQTKFPCIDTAIRDFHSSSFSDSVDTWNLKAGYKTVKDNASIFRYFRPYLVNNFADTQVDRLNGIPLIDTIEMNGHYVYRNCDCTFFLSCKVVDVTLIVNYNNYP
jgi:hypothetical protein